MNFVAHVLLLLRILVLFDFNRTGLILQLHLGIENGEKNGKALQKMNK